MYTETLETSADASDGQMIHDSSDHTRMPQSSDDASGHPAEDAAQYATSSTGDPSNSNSTDSDSTWLSEQLTVLRIKQTADNLEKVVNHPTMTVPTPLIRGKATWMVSFIEMVDLLLNMIHLQRTGNFEGNHPSISAMMFRIKSTQLCSQYMYELLSCRHERFEE